MAEFDRERNRLTLKLVYYGPAQSGKTTNLSCLHESISPELKGDMMVLETKGDRTLFFDLLPLNLGKISGFDIRIQLYTVPGQVMYEATRKLVLKGVDGLVFVADPLKVRQERNIESLEDLRRNVAEHGLDLKEMPLVLQYNKRDLCDTPVPTLTVEELEQDLNQEYKVPWFECTATKGPGVFETLKEISKRTVNYVANKHLFNK